MGFGVLGFFWLSTSFPVTLLNGKALLLVLFLLEFPGGEGEKLPGGRALLRVFSTGERELCKTLSPPQKAAPAAVGPRLPYDPGRAPYLRQSLDPSPILRMKF